MNKLLAFFKAFIGLFILGIIFLFFVFSIWKDSQDIAIKKNDSKQIELFDTLLCGYENGNLSWQIVAENIWAGRSRFLYRAKKLQYGRVFNKRGQVIIDDMVAEDLQLNSKAKTVKAHGGVSAVFKDRKDGDNWDALDPIKVRAGVLEYYRHSNRTILTEDVQVLRKGFYLLPKANFEIDHDKDEAEARDGFTLESELYSIDGGRLMMDIPSKSIFLEKGVSGIRRSQLAGLVGLDDREISFRSQDTSFDMDALVIEETGNDRIFTLSGGFRIEQDGRRISGESALYDTKQKLFKVEGAVELVMDSLEWVVDKSKKRDFDNPEAKEAVSLPTTIRTDRMYFNGTTKVVTFVGRVVISQENKTIRCNKAEYYDDSGDIVLSGAVEINRDGLETFNTEKLIINVTHETVLAEGGKKGIVTEFEIK